MDLHCAPLSFSRPTKEAGIRSSVRVQLPIQARGTDSCSPAPRHLARMPCDATRGEFLAEQKYGKPFYRAPTNSSSLGHSASNDAGSCTVYCTAAKHQGRVELPVCSGSAPGAFDQEPVHGTNLDSTELSQQQHVDVSTSTTIESERENKKRKEKTKEERKGEQRRKRKLQSREAGPLALALAAFCVVSLRKQVKASVPSIYASSTYLRFPCLHAPTVRRH